MTTSLKKILADVPGGVFSDPFLARYMFPKEFPTLDMVPHVALNSSLKDMGMEKYITDTDREPPKPATHETRLCLPLGSMRNREINTFCDELVKRVGPVLVRPFRKHSGILNQTVPQNVETPVKLAQIAADVITVPSLHPPDDDMVVKAPEQPGADAPTTTSVARDLRYKVALSRIEAQNKEHRQYVVTPGTSMYNTLDTVTKRLKPETDGDIQSPKPVYIVPPKDEEKDGVPPLEELPPLEPEPATTTTTTTMKEPVKQAEREPVAPAWINVRSKKQLDSGSSESSDESNSILAGDESSHDISDHRSEVSVYESASEGEGESSSDEGSHPKLGQDEDSVSSDQPPQEIIEKTRTPKKRKIPERKARHTKVEPWTVDHGEDLVENAKGDLVPAKKAKSKKAQPKKKKPASAKASNKRAASNKTPRNVKRQMTYVNKPFDQTKLFTPVRLDQYQIRDTDLYKCLRELWLNMLWVAAHNLYGDARAKDTTQWPYQSTFTGKILKEARQSLTPQSPKLLRAIFSCMNAEAVEMPNNYYRICFSSPAPDTEDLYPHELGFVTCKGHTEYASYIRAHFALRPAAYLMWLAKKICDQTKNLPEADGSAQELYEHNKVNRKQVDTVFIDWANMALLSNFTIIQ